MMSAVRRPGWVLVSGASNEWVWHTSLIVGLSRHVLMAGAGIRGHDYGMTEGRWRTGQALPARTETLETPGGGTAGSMIPLQAFHHQVTPSGRRDRISVVIPALNEAENLRWLLPQLATADEVIVVDGESADGTDKVVREICPRAALLRQQPHGKGAALRAGFAFATGDVIVMLDADGSMDPFEIDTFVALIARGFDVVKGSRNSCGGGSEDLTLLRRAGNRLFVWFANVLYRTGWSDLCYGYIALRRSALDRLRLHSDGFEIETEICVHAVTAKLAVAEVPSYELNRRSGASNLRPFRDGWRVLKVLLRNRWRQRREIARWLTVSQIPAEQAVPELAPGHAVPEPADRHVLLESADG
jgi:Glycosyl transferase family 2